MKKKIIFIGGLFLFLLYIFYYYNTMHINGSKIFTKQFDSSEIIILLNNNKNNYDSSKLNENNSKKLDLISSDKLIDTFRKINFIRRDGVGLSSWEKIYYQMFVKVDGNEYFVQISDTGSFSIQNMLNGKGNRYSIEKEKFNIINNLIKSFRIN